MQSLVLHASLLKQLLVSKALSKALSYNTIGLRSSFCRRRESLCTAVATSNCLNEAVFSAKLEGSLLLKFRRILLGARRRQRTTDPHCSRKHPEAALPDTTHLQSATGGATRPHAMRRNLSCLAALVVLALSNKVRLIIVDRAIRLLLS